MKHWMLRACTALVMVAGSLAGLSGTAGATPPADCAVPVEGRTHCTVVSGAGTAQDMETAQDAPSGYGPAELRAAYRLPQVARTSTVAVVSVFDHPSAEADLATYRAQFGLPACASQDGCFRKVNQRGEAAPLPPANQGWGLQAAAGVQLVSATCPRCRILLVEADNTAYPSLGAAVDTAVRLGAGVVVVGPGTDENSLAFDYAGHYRHPGVAIVAASGDGGFRPASFPAVLDTVIAVGGTTLTRPADGQSWSEQAWGKSGSGCSAYVRKPRWQRDRSCGMRTVADVSAVGDPQTGLAVYDSFLPEEVAGWQVVGGTGASAAIIGGVYGLGGGANGGPGARGLYDLRRYLADVVGGSNGFCGEDYLCTAVRGYDGPTGLGTPRGVGAF